MLQVNNLTGFGVGGGFGGIDAFTVLMLHGDGADASTTFTDSSANNYSPSTVGGNAQIDTGQSKFGGASMQFDGAGDYLAYANQANFAFGTGDFSIDCWVRFSASGASQAVIDFRPNLEGAYPLIYADGSSHIVYQANSAVQITGTTALTSGVWYHVALTRSGTSTKLFLNGTQEGSTYSDSTNYIVGTNAPFVGILSDLVSFPLNGWIDELRISKGVARWTANFTPPTVPYDDAG